MIHIENSNVPEQQKEYNIKKNEFALTCICVIIVIYLAIVFMFKYTCPIISDKTKYSEILGETVQIFDKPYIVTKVHKNMVFLHDGSNYIELHVDAFNKIQKGNQPND